VYYRLNIKFVVFTARCIYISAVFAVMQCPSVCHVRALCQNE